MPNWATVTSAVAVLSPTLAVTVAVPSATGNAFLLNPDDRRIGGFESRGRRFVARFRRPDRPPSQRAAAASAAR